MNYKLKDGITKEFFRGTKIRVNPTESEMLQNELFKLGIFWESGIDTPSYLYMRYLIVGNSITSEDSEFAFNHFPEREIFFNDIFEPCENESQLQVATSDGQIMPHNIDTITEQVEKPDYYKFKLDGKDYQVIDVCEALKLDEDAYLFQAFTYIARCGKKKGNAQIDELKKAKYYLERKIKQLESSNN